MGLGGLVKSGLPEQGVSITPPAAAIKIGLRDLGQPSRVYTTQPSEIVIGIVGALGTDTTKICEYITERLREYAYHPEIIKLSTTIIPAIAGEERIPADNKYERAKALIELGNAIRQETGNCAVLAAAAAAEIYRRRLKLQGNNPEQYVGKTAYLITSLKHPDEVAELRQIYGSGFYLFGIHTDRDRRIHNLQGDKWSIPRKGMEEAKAVELIHRDEHEADTHGQHTRDTFQLADFFLADENNDEKLRQSTWRCLDLIFGHPHITPTFNEFAMFMAFAASLRSADLSRQVGAVIARKEEILATGANDCPRAGGGLYWPEFLGDRIDDAPRGRDYKRGYDSNSVEKANISAEIKDGFVSACQWNGSDTSVRQSLESALATLPHDRREKVESILNDIGAEIFQLMAELGTGPLITALQKSRIADITEYGRVVHAEMEALSACARNNVSCRDSTLYSTTFPCHNCAKHIIAAGIEQVIYIEPYPKSKALEFHDDAVTTTKVEAGEKKVRFKPFVGVGPRRFFDLFSLSLGNGRKVDRKDKNDGTALAWQPSQARPRVQMLPVSHRKFEEVATEYLNRIQNGAEQE